MTKTLEENQAFVKAMREVVEEAGRDYVFSDICRYFNRHSGCPLCIVGHAMAKIGVVSTEFFRMKNIYDGDLNATEASKVLTRMGYDWDVAEAANIAQAIQDGRSDMYSGRGTWGQAIDAFNERLKGTKYQ